MKKLCSILICLLLLLCTVPFAPAAGDAPEISMQPQNYHYPEYSVAMYTVKAGGNNLHATWYLEFEGKTYTLSDNQNPVEPWESYAGESYGPFEDGDTFGWFFSGIEAGLNGAEIWCVMEDGHYDVTSARAIITVQGSVMPPEILSMPAQVVANVGEEVVARCVAKSANGEQLAFQWYETPTGKLQDIRAIDGEDCDYIFCDTSTVGTRYFVCGITGTTGGRVYSSVLPVTVTQPVTTTPVAEPCIVTESLPQATVGETYSFLLECTDPAALYALWYNPGQNNAFEATGLELLEQGLITGTPTQAGSYTFCVCAVGAGGEDYREYTLVVAEAEQTPTEAEPTTPVATEPAAEPSTPPITEAPTELPSPEEEAFPVWGYALVAFGGIGAGIGAAFLLTHTQKP